MTYDEAVERMAAAIDRVLLDVGSDPVRFDERVAARAAAEAIDLKGVLQSLAEAEGAVDYYRENYSE